MRTAPSAAAAAEPTLDTPLARSGFVAPTTARRLMRLELHTVRDLLFHLPRRYDDFSRSVQLRTLRDEPPEGPVTTTVQVVELRVEQGFRRRVQRTVARISDDSGEGEAVWFGRRYIERRLKPGDSVVLSGKVQVRGWMPSFQNPEFGSADASVLHAGRIVPVYRLTGGVTSQTLRRIVREALDRVGVLYPEYLPTDALERGGIANRSIAAALEAAHYPADFEGRDEALRRLAFDELLALQIGMLVRDHHRRGQRSVPLHVAEAEMAEAVSAVEARIAAAIRARLLRSARTDEDLDAAQRFEARLTDDQLGAVEEIRRDLASERPMLRLLQGDVGSGKTAVAALALAFAAAGGRQGALLAPTDLLARQHAATLSTLLEGLGHEVTLLTGSLPAADRRRALETIAAPPVPLPGGRSLGRVIVGTHALMQEGVQFEDLAVAVVDEQHRFGVAEREALSAKGTAPHVLLMTATPIPQTLARVVHADLDVSVLRASPQGRAPIRTGIRSTEQLAGRGTDPSRGTWPLLVREILDGHRAFVVVPLVEEDEEGDGRSVEQAARLLHEGLPEAARLLELPQREYRIGIVHGQMRSADRDLVMDAFRRGELDVLVGTTVLEVGVDVPEATVMVVLDAERFGVAQLHQLRGRVGRGEAASYCVLVSDRYPHGQPADRDSEEQAAVRARLDALASTQDGFLLAELDLQQRREGELLGLTQSGLPPFRVARLTDAQDLALSVRAREVAATLLDDDGRLRPELEALDHELRRGWLARIGAGEVVADAPT